MAGKISGISIKNFAGRGVVDEKGNRNTINNVKNRKGEFYGKF